MAVENNDGNSLIQDFHDCAKICAGAFVLGAFFLAAAGSVKGMIKEAWGVECMHDMAFIVNRNPSSEDDAPWIMGADGPKHGGRTQSDWNSQLTCSEAEAAIAVKLKKGNG